MSTTNPYVLSIAGFDPSAGAGVLADIKTFEGNGVYGMGVVSALTWQNDTEFDKVEWISVDRITSQVDVLLRRFDIRYIKIGLVQNMYVLQHIIKYLHLSIDKPVIIYDPIMKASAGFVFHNEAHRVAEALRGVYCITPNIPEAEQLFGKENLQEKLEQQSDLLNIYLKGGHDDAETATDMLFIKDHTHVFTNDRLPNGEKHGSGCVLSAALTAQLALGNNISGAAEYANAYTYDFLRSTDTLLGSHKSFAL